MILLQFLFTVSLAYILATLQVTFRDTNYLLGIFLFLFFYLTPVFWDGSNISGPLGSIFRLNPFAALLNAYRGILMHGQWPDARPMLTLCLIGLVILAVGSMTFARARNRFVEEL